MKFKDIPHWDGFMEAVNNSEDLDATAAASKQHFLCVYHQVQLWQSNPLPSEQWGWKRETDNLVPVTTDLPLAPEKLLHLISCTCRKNCLRTCSCVKGGLKFSIVCVSCREVSCSNSTIQSEEEIMDELGIPSCDTDNSDTEESEESIEDNQHIMDHESEDEKQKEISCGDPSDSGTEKLRVLPSTSTAMEHPRKLSRRSHF